VSDGRAEQLAALRRNIQRWGCDQAAYATSVAGCRQLNEQAARLSAELGIATPVIGGDAPAAPAAVTKANAEQAQPPRSRPYNFEWRTNPNGRYRTLCVRLCDGYIYPMSSATTPSSFAAQEKQCQSSCASPSKLFYANTGEDVDQMVALTGEGYAGLPNAFRYRSDSVEDCTCKPKLWSTEAGAAHGRRDVADRTLAELIVADGAAGAAKALAGGDVAVAAVTPDSQPAKVYKRKSKARARTPRPPAELRYGYGYGARYYDPRSAYASPYSYGAPRRRGFFRYGSR
jgi:hypothetical protein